jgi:hypothetical protein
VHAIIVVVGNRVWVSLALLAVFAAGCNGSPTEPSSWSFDRVREQLLISNLNASVFGQPGRTTRWRTPIAVSTNGIARAEEALDHYERWTSGVVQFARVTGIPANGIVFVEGGAVAPDTTAACGSLTDAPPPSITTALTFRWDAARAITGVYYLHLGSDNCDDAEEGDYPSEVAEHQLAHALGVIDHFVGFNDTSGLADPRLLAVVFNLYANPVGSTAGELTIWGSR